MATQQARHWLGTLSCAQLPGIEPGSTDLQRWNLAELRGQREIGAGGFEHWQLCASFTRPTRLNAVVRIFGGGHWEPTRSEHARAYVLKPETRVAGTQFILGAPLMRRSEQTDWDSVWEAAKTGEINNIPSDIRIRCYHQVQIHNSNSRTSSKAFLEHMSDLLQWTAPAMYSGESLTLESRIVPGQKVWQTVHHVSAKIPQLSGGMVIKVMNVLSLMSFVGKSVSVISCDGSIVIHVEWKPKGDRCPSWQLDSGSQATWIPDSGIQN